MPADRRGPLPQGASGQHFQGSQAPKSTKEECSLALNRRVRAEGTHATKTPRNGYGYRSLRTENASPRVAAHAAWLGDLAVARRRSWMSTASKIASDSKRQGGTGPYGLVSPILARCNRSLSPPATRPAQHTKKRLTCCLVRRAGANCSISCAEGACRARRDPSAPRSELSCIPRSTSLGQ
jgi:hypothetical protein